MAKRKVHDHLSVDKYSIPIFLYKELRSSVRFSITKKGLVIRCPYLTISSQITDQAKVWCKSTIIKKPAAFSEFLWKDYFNEKSFSIYGDIYDLDISRTPAPNDKIYWQNETLHLEVNDKYNPAQESKAIRSLLAKFVAKRYLYEISEKVKLINQRYFNITIGKISLKNNRSNWGSCSNKGNINLSVKLLKAPQEIIDYVIIHELAHRIEMNHSAKFWKVVEKACPDYKEKEKWLKDNSHLCTL